MEEAKIIERRIEDSKARISEIKLELEDEMSTGFYRTILYDMLKAEGKHLESLELLRQDLISRGV